MADDKVPWTMRSDVSMSVSRSGETSKSYTGRPEESRSTNCAVSSHDGPRPASLPELTGCVPKDLNRCQRRHQPVLSHMSILASLEGPDGQLSQERLRIDG